MDEWVERKMGEREKTEAIQGFHHTVSSYFSK